MSRSIAIILLSLVLLSGLYYCVYRWITAETALAMKSDRPELEWLRREYDLSNEQFTTIRARHKAHDVVCRQLCRDLVTAQKRLEAAIAGHGSLTVEVQAAMTAWTKQRERCREATLSHMYDVSSLMNEEDAIRYRKRVFRHLIVPGRMPHVGSDGEFHEGLIEHADPGPIDPVTSEDGQSG